MVNAFEFVADLRERSGKSVARNLRRQGKVPAVIYGGGAEAQMLALSHNQVLKNLEQEAVYSHILDVKVGGVTQKAILKAIQRHPFKPQIMHIDFQRVAETEKVRVHVPLHFINEAVSLGVKQGGVVTRSLIEVEVSCLPANLPEFIEVDLASLDVGQTLHLSDLKLPAGVELVALSHGPEHDLPVVSIVAMKTHGAAE